jgi:hypothetical protein
MSIWGKWVKTQDVVFSRSKHFGARKSQFLFFKPQISRINTANILPQGTQISQIWLHRAIL